MAVAKSAHPGTQNPLAQDAEQQQPVPRITANVREVLVPVVVTDPKGHHVGNLKRSDFKVSEDGFPQEIVAFRTTVDSDASEAGQEAGRETSAPAGSPPKPAQRPAPAPGAVRRTYLICIDTLHSSFASFGRVRDALLKSLRQEQGTDTQYALMALGRDLTVVKDSTPDAAAIVAAIGSKGFAKVIQTSEAASTAVAIQDFTALMRNYCSVCACESNVGGDQPGCLAVKSRVKAFLVSFEERTYILNHNFLLQLNDLVRATASMPTSRTIIFISDGFNRSPGRELYGIVRGFAPRDHTFQFPSRDTEPELQTILKAATGYDVKFYTLDSRGVYSSAFSAGNSFDASTAFSTTPAQMDARNVPTEATSTIESVDQQAASAGRENADVMAQLAHETGGLFFQNSNDLPKGITRALTDTREYYVLAYVPKNEASDGKYRKIKVEVNGGDKFRVNAKAGYWATEK
ncbi:MAG: VWA domain-containing protein [Bryobacteraceae bacterium]